MIDYGGVLCCSNGVHRFVAAKCWLINKYGDNALIKKVSVTTKTFNEAYLDIFRSCVETGVDLRYICIDDGHTALRFIQIGTNGIIYEISRDDYLPDEVNIKQRISILKRIRYALRQKNLCYISSAYGWNVIPNDLVKILIS